MAFTGVGTSDINERKIEWPALNYAQVGSGSSSAADRLVEKIAVMALRQRRRSIARERRSIGGYASLFELDKKRWLAASTDGVGTKLKLAFRLKSIARSGSIWSRCR